MMSSQSTVVVAASQRMVAMAVDPYGDGYWELGLRGVVWPEGDVVSYGNGS